MTGRTVLVVLACWGAAQAPAAERGKLAAAPRARRDGRDVTVTFALTAANDVTVRIVDGKGNVVRHLASGMVGLDRAAAPLAAKSLSQTLTWDGADDAGRPVAPAGCKVSVAVGMRATFDRFILWQKDAFDGCTRIVEGPNNEYVVFQGFGTRADTARAFSAEGKFLRCLWPCTLRGPEAKGLLAASPFAGEGRDGRRVPVRVIHNMMIEDFGTRFTQVVIASDGTMVGVQGYGAGTPSVPLLHRATPWGFPTATAWAVPWHPRRAPAGTPAAVKKLWRATGRALWTLAPGRKGEFYLADGVHHVVARFRAADFSPVNFTHCGAEKLAQPRNTLGEIDKPGDDVGHFKGPNGVTVGEDGRLLVLDGDTVKVYDADGKFVERTTKQAFEKVRRVVRDGGIGAYAITKAVDRAGNLMATVGRYGNEDCAGGGGDRALDGTDIIVDPEVPLARPQGVAVRGDRLFISDMYAHRVMRCRLAYAEKREVAVE